MTLKQAKYTKKFIIITAIILFINVLYIPTAFAAVSSGSLVSLVNSSRSQAGLATLSTNGQLESAASAKAADMFLNQYFAHTSPQGKTPWDFIGATGYSYVYGGENLAIGYTDAGELHNAWMNSPSHRENIMNPNFREIGIASASGDYEGSPTTIVVQMFGSTNSSQPVANINEESVSGDTKTQQASPTKAFTLNNDKTKFSPNKVYAGDEVEFQVTLKGEVSELFINYNGDKIDLLDSLKNSGEEKDYIKKVKMSKEGESAVSVTAVDKSGNREVKDLGKLIVAKKVIIKGAQNNGYGFWGGLVEFANNNILYISSTIGLTALLLGAYLIFRYRKFGSPDNKYPHN